MKLQPVQIDCSYTAEKAIFIKKSKQITATANNYLLGVHEWAV